MKKSTFDTNRSYSQLSTFNIMHWWSRRFKRVNPRSFHHGICANYNPWALHRNNQGISPFQMATVETDDWEVLGQVVQGMSTTISSYIQVDWINSTHTWRIHGSSDGWKVSTHQMTTVRTCSEDSSRKGWEDQSGNHPHSNLNSHQTYCQTLPSSN